MKVTAASILKSGWGIFLAIVGVLSIGLDIAAPVVTTAGGRELPMFSGSFTFGWLLAITVMIGPAAAIRASGVAPIHKGLGFLWCFVAFSVWVVLRAALSGGQPSPMGMLLVLACLRLCWSLLTLREEAPPLPVSPEQRRYYYRVPGGDIQGPDRLDVIRGRFSGEALPSVEVVEALGQSAGALKSASWKRVWAPDAANNTAIA